MRRGPSCKSNVGGMTSGRFLLDDVALALHPDFFFFFFFLGGGGVLSFAAFRGGDRLGLLGFFASGVRAAAPRRLRRRRRRASFSSSSGASATTFCGFFAPDGVLPRSTAPPSFVQKRARPRP